MRQWLAKETYKYLGIWLKNGVIKKLELKLKSLSVSDYGKKSLCANPLKNDIIFWFTYLQWHRDIWNETTLGIPEVVEDRDNRQKKKKKNHLRTSASVPLLFKFVFKFLFKIFNAFENLLYNKFSFFSLFGIFWGEYWIA